MADTRGEQFIGILKLNACEYATEIARKMKMSRSTVQDRLRRLEKSG